MDKMEDSFVFYPSFIQQIEAVKSPEVRGRLYSAVAQYGCYNTMPDFSDIDPLGMLDGLFVAIKRAIDDQRERRETQRRNGAKGGAPIGNTNARKQPNSSENNLYIDKAVNTDINSNKLSNESKKKTRCVFSAPSLDEVKDFFKANSFTSDPEAFFDYYEANGWTQGNRKPLQKWEAAARQWERRQAEFSPARSTSRHRQQERPMTAATDPGDEPTDFGGRQY